ncbi:MFS transporter [Cognatishimia activa]|uniref:MFS transporter n=1 Tax=Cognatishimia activa TaxID=1715691 RepID=UPI00223297B3|nr:MFS transporter [Cognatishimia activa]UZD90899.1 MFS transporter [Cognatishimia activa]
MTAISTRRRIWGWFFFDWASQPYHTLLLTFIFGPYIAGVAAETFIADGASEEAAKAQAQTLWSTMLTIAGLIIGLSAPILGALADTTGRRRPWISTFSLMYVVGAASLWFAVPDGSNLIQMLVLFAVGFIGAEFVLIFINAQLPSLGSDQEVGKISGSGFAFGYLGGFLALLILLAFFAEQGNGKTLLGMDPAFGLDANAKEGTRAVGPIVAIWFAVFMVPYFLWVKDDAPKADRINFAKAMSQLSGSIRALRKRVSLASYLGSSMFYRDALGGLYGFGGTYARLVLDWSIVQIGVFGIISIIAAAIFSWLGGKADFKRGPKPVIKFCIWMLIAVCIVVVSMDRTQIFGMALAEGSSIPDLVFYGCGILIGGMGGILQSASRSLMVRHSDPDNPTESFGLFGLSGRATAFLAPASIGAVTAMTESARIGISPLIVLFLLGLFLLRWVKPEGDRAEWDASSQS